MDGLAMRRCNEAGLAITKSHEKCILTPYWDSAGGVWTVGWGHTGPDVTAETPPYTQEQADAVLAADMATAEHAVERWCRAPLTDNQFSALCDFTFNVGAGAFHGSTMLRRLNAGEDPILVVCGSEMDQNGNQDVPGEIFKWRLSGGKIREDLVRRRRQEADLFATPD